MRLPTYRPPRLAAAIFAQTRTLLHSVVLDPSRTTSAPERMPIYPSGAGMYGPALAMQGTENMWIDQVLESRTRVEDLCANLFARGVHSRALKSGADVGRAW